MSWKTSLRNPSWPVPLRRSCLKANRRKRRALSHSFGHRRHRAGPPRVRQAGLSAKKLIAAAALGIAVGTAGALIVIDRDALRESQPPSSVTAQQSVGRPPAPVSDDRVAATSLTIPKIPAASLPSQPAPTKAPELSAPTHARGQPTREAAALPIPADVSTSEPAIPTLVFQGALAEVPPAAARPSAVAESPRPEPLVPQPSPGPAVAATAERAVGTPLEIRSNNDQRAIDEVLSNYRAAYEARNAAAVKRVWPAANEGALVKAFANLESQNLAFYGCRTSIEGATARTSCDGQVSYVARRGSKNSRTEHRNWTFILGRTSTDDWQIDGVQIQ